MLLRWIGAREQERRNVCVFNILRGEGRNGAAGGGRGQSKQTKRTGVAHGGLVPSRIAGHSVGDGSRKRGVADIQRHSPMSLTHPLSSPEGDGFATTPAHGRRLPVRASATWTSLLIPNSLCKPSQIAPRSPRESPAELQRDQKDLARTRIVNPIKNITFSNGFGDPPGTKLDPWDPCGRRPQYSP